MSKQPSASPTDVDRPASYPVIDPSRSIPLLGPVGAMTSDLRFAVTGLSPDEQRALWLAEDGKAGEGEGEVGGEGEEADDEGEGQGEKEQEEEKDNRPVYPLLADPSSPNCPFNFGANTVDCLPLASFLSPAEQHAEWLKEQEKKSVGQNKAEQAAQAGGAVENGA